MLPLAIWLDGTVRLDRFATWFESRYDGRPYFLHRSGGHVYSSYPVGAALLVTPLYAPLAIAAPQLRSWSTRDLVLLARVLEKIAASLVACATVAMFFLLAGCYVSPGRAALLAFTFAFATSMWSICSQAMWQHTPGLLAIVASLYFLARGWIPAAALAAALSMAMRPTNILFVATSMAVVLWKDRRWTAAAWYGGFALIVGGILAFYNSWLFEDVRGGYAQPFSGDFFGGLAGLLFSPARGLFIYTPLALLALCQRPKNSVQWITAAFAVTHVLLYAKWPMWWGGHCWGPRMLAEVTPAVVLLLMHARLTPAFVFLALLSTGVQYLGAFHYPKGAWESVPAEVDVQPGRLWDWKDNPIGRTAQAGPLVSAYSYALEAIRAVREGRSPDFGHVPLASIRYNIKR